MGSPGSGEGIGEGALVPPTCFQKQKQAEQHLDHMVRGMAQWQLEELYVLVSWRQASSLGCLCHESKTALPQLDHCHFGGSTRTT